MQQTTVIPQLLSIDKVFDVPMCRSCGFLGCILEEYSRDPTVATRWSMDDVNRCGADRGVMPQINEIVWVIQLARLGAAGAILVVVDVPVGTCAQAQDQG